ncbi:MAG: GNAT family N-acetyltransferase [Actinobacteria bacterium]|nr:GNAT family N-acetyltransferase [Actinomycetota bacterium]
MLFEASLLDGAHEVIAFDCGTPSLNLWLNGQALRDQNAGQNRTHVWTSPDDLGVVAFYSLSPIIDIRQRLAVPRSVHRGYAMIPGYLLARLALDRTLHGQGLGGELLVDATSTAVEAARAGGGRVLYVDAIDDAAMRFYEHFGFVQTAVPMRLVAKISDLADSLGR